MNHPDSTKHILESVNTFYERSPFPGYDLTKYTSRDDLKRQASWFGQLLDAQIPYDVDVLDAGCGTGQLSAFLALKDRRVLGIDYSQASLEKGDALKERLHLSNVTFRRANLLDLDLPTERFDYVLCMGVLHHTSDPEGGFANLVRTLRPGGFIVVGLYNTYGRLLLRLRRHLVRMRGRAETKERAIRKQIGDRDPADHEKVETWYSDQYEHPHESCHTVEEVLGWFRRYGIEYVSSFPPLELFRRLSDNRKVFKRQPAQPWRSHPMCLLLVQLKWIITLNGGGGYFTLVGQKPSVEPRPV